MSMKATVGQLARLVKGKIYGNRDTVITGFAGIREARPGDITFLANKRYLPLLSRTKASAVVVDKAIKICQDRLTLPLVLVANPDLAFARLVAHFSPPPPDLARLVHPQAIVSPRAKLGRDVAIQPFAVIQPGAKIGDRTVIYPNVYIGHQAVLGQDCLIYPNVVIRERCLIGDRVIIHSGTVIGSDGFGYATVKGVHHKIPQVGIVKVESDVEIGANVTIDRARFGQTLIGRGTKIDNLVQIAHNVRIGPNSIIVAQAGISGSTRLGKNVTLAGQVGVVGHIRIGNNVTVAGKSVVTKDIPAGAVVSGNPAQPHIRQQRELALIRKLPQIYQAVKDLQRPSRR